eukprot:30612-Pelagococcus_subviridis.AAC.9
MRSTNEPTISAGRPERLRDRLPHRSLRDAGEEDLIEAAEDARERAAARKRQRVPDRVPQHGHHARQREALHQHGEHVLSLHDAGVERGQTGDGHEQHERCGEEDHEVCHGGFWFFFLARDLSWTFRGLGDGRRGGANDARTRGDEDPGRVRLVDHRHDDLRGGRERGRGGERRGRRADEQRGRENLFADRRRGLVRRRRRRLRVRDDERGLVRGRRRGRDAVKIEIFRSGARLHRDRRALGESGAGEDRARARERRPRGRAFFDCSKGRARTRDDRRGGGANDAARRHRVDSREGGRERIRKESRSSGRVRAVRRATLM